MGLIDQDCPAGSIVEREGNLDCGPAEIDRHDNRTGPGNREIGFKKMITVKRKHGNTVARTKALYFQDRRDPGHPFPQLSETLLPCPADCGNPMRVLLDGAF
jgi:hypothetical protein